MIPVLCQIWKDFEFFFDPQKGAPKNAPYWAISRFGDLKKIKEKLGKQANAIDNVLICIGFSYVFVDLEDYYYYYYYYYYIYYYYYYPMVPVAICMYTTTTTTTIYYLLLLLLLRKNKKSKN